MSVLKVSGLTKNYGKKCILDNISFEIDKGDLIGLVGPNGAGKSTLMRSILSLEDAESGKITVKNISNQNPDFFKYVTFLPSDNYLYMELTGYDHLAFIASIYHLEKKDIEGIIDLVGIRTYVNKPVQSYSYGMRQHLLIALSVLTKPLLILMDEPFNGLDPTSTIELKQLIRTLHSQGVSILISTHNLDILEDLTNTIWFIKDGHLSESGVSLDDDFAYEIEVSDSGNKSLEYLMHESPLPFQVIDGRILTDTRYETEKYLDYLMRKGVKIISVNRSKKKLVEMYKHFYDV